MIKIYLGIPEYLQTYCISKDSLSINSVILRSILNLIDLRSDISQVNDPNDADILHLWRSGYVTRYKTEALCREFSGKKKIIIEACGNSVSVGWEWINQDRILRGQQPKIYNKEDVDTKENFLIDNSNVFRVPSLISKNSFMTGNCRDQKICVRPPGYNSGIYKYERRVCLDMFKDKFVVAFFGRFRYRRGFHNFIDIITRINKNDDMMFIACGMSADATQYAELKLNNKMQLLSLFEPNDSKEMAAVMMSAHVAVAPAIESGYSLSTAEAMACGCYPLISANAGISYLALQHGLGNIINPYNVDIWVKNLYSLYDTFKRKSELFNGNCERIAKIMQKYNYKNFMEELEHDYRRIL
jgi:glycosyltransferase involved in cell wall biosynthesis